MQTRFTSTGTVTAATGTIAFSGATNIFWGTINGAGAVSFTGGVSTIKDGTTVSIASLTVTGASTTLTVPWFMLYAGALTVGSGATISVTSGATMTTTGAFSASGGATVKLSGGYLILGRNEQLQRRDGDGRIYVHGHADDLRVRPDDRRDGDLREQQRADAERRHGDGRRRQQQRAFLFNAATGTYDITDDSGIAGGPRPPRFRQLRPVREDWRDRNQHGAGEVHQRRNGDGGDGNDRLFRGKQHFLGDDQRRRRGQLHRRRVDDQGRDDGRRRLADRDRGVDDAGDRRQPRLCGKLLRYFRRDGSSIASGATLSLSGTATLSGKVAGAGGLAITGGTTTINPSASVSVANLSVTGVGTTLAIGTAIGFGHAFSAGGGATLNLSGGDLALHGSEQLQRRDRDGRVHALRHRGVLRVRPDDRRDGDLPEQQHADRRTAAR